LAVTLSFWLGIAQANPYIAKPGEAPLRLRIATCSVTGGFVHLYTALENNLFDKYGFKLEHIYIRGTGPSLAALIADEIQFLYCAAEATIPALASGIEAKIVAAPLVKMPFVLVTQKEIRRLEDLRGKSLGIVRPGDLSDRLSRQLVKRFNLPDVTMRPIGGSQSERYQAMTANLVQGVVITPPLDVRAKTDGYNVVYRLIDMDLPFIYSSLHTSSRMIRERGEAVQRMVAAFAEAVQFAEKNPAKSKAAMAKVMRIKDEEALNVSYNVYAKEIVDRRMTVPSLAVSESVELHRASGLPVKRKAEAIFDNTFVTNLDKIGFQKELWGR
jgi:NitT/TauT family transport system substrate-binding protein